MKMCEDYLLVNVESKLAAIGEVHLLVFYQLLVNPYTANVIFYIEDKNSLVFLQVC